MRGIPVVHVPTTLLAQVDSSIGGKTGVNYGKYGKTKNLVGVFHQPKFVLSDVALLKTLPPREIKSGLAEVIKYGIIKDKKLFGLLERKSSELLGLRKKVLVQAITKSCRAKAEGG